MPSCFIGRSTNGRSSAFGALCLGSNPSRPAKIQWSVDSGQLAADGGAVSSYPSSIEVIQGFEQFEVEGEKAKYG